MSSVQLTPVSSDPEVLAGFFHYVRVGPNRADDEEDHGQAEAPVHQVDPSVHTFDPHERR